MDDVQPAAPLNANGLWLTREQKSAQYGDISYNTLLADEGSFMRDCPTGIAPESKTMCEALLTSEQTYLPHSLFRDEEFEQTCQSVQDGNEDRVLRDITPLIVPSTGVLAARGADGLQCLIGCRDEVWDNAVPLTTTSVQPDISIGFRREAFTDSEFAKLRLFLKIYMAREVSFFRSTDDMYFPFLTTEVKCGPQGLDIADRHNAHASTLGARAIVELFRLAGREQMLSRQTLTFSISHNEHSVRIHACYPLMEDNRTSFYRYTLREFSFTADGGAERWAAYRFVRNLYELWMPEHLQLLRGAIRHLPSQNDLGLDLDALRESLRR
jgi:hypothetical protein